MSLKKLKHSLKIKKHSQKFNSEETGMSLLEVIIALGIISGILIVLTSSWTGNFRRVKKAKIQTQIVYLLQKKMSEIEVQYGKKPKELPEEKQKGKFKDEFKSYSWEWEAKEFELPDFAAILTASSGAEGAEPLELLVMGKMKDFLEESIREVKLTIIHRSKDGLKTPVSISTILVDYDTALDLNIDPSILQSLGGG